jgi:hypothetical protein
MKQTELAAPLLEQGINSVNFFNGRVLTAEDLRDQAAAGRQHDQRLGRAVGAGVFEGLTVDRGPDQRSLLVAEGMAVNRLGQTLALPGDVQVALVPEAEPAGAAPGPSFVECTPGPAVLAGTGVFLLVIAPASGSAGGAPKVPAGAAGVATECGPRYTVEGVRFGLVKVELDVLAPGSGHTSDQLATLLAGTAEADRSTLRNALAHAFLAAPALAGPYADPAAADQDQPARYGPLDELQAAGRLAACEVPLALMCWTDTGVSVVDTWAVRRRPHRQPHAPWWDVAVSDRRRTEGEARFLQFQEHLGWLTRPAVTAAELTAVRATDHFRFLPPAAVVPMVGLLPGEDPQARGFAYPRFLEGVTHRRGPGNQVPVHPSFLSAAALEALLRAAVGYPPVDLAGGEFLWLYVVTENRAATQAAQTPAPAPYGVLVSGHLPFLGDPRFDLARVDLATYGFGEVPIRI